MVSTNTTLRVTGLASGMNTDEIVSNLVKAQSARLNKLKQSKTLATWKQDSYRDVNKKIDAFKKAMESLRLESSFNKQTVSSSNSNVEVTSSGTSSQTDFVLKNVTLATTAKPATVSFNSVTGGNVGTSGLSFNLNGKDVTLQAGWTVDQAVTEINKYTSVTSGYTGPATNVKASNVGGSLVLTGINTTQAIDVTLVSGSGLDISTKSASATQASTGSVNINGTTIAISSNTFTFDGVTFNLKGDVTSDVTVQTSSDTQGIFDNIKTFVDKYNELIADFNGKLTEKKYRDYAPLLDEQKEAMKDSEITLWEEKAKSGLLSNDSTISSFLFEMRNSLVSKVENSNISTNFNSLKSIGISFSTNYKDNGKLILDEDKLKGVLKTNLDDVKKLFTIKQQTTDTSTTATSTTMHKNSGFAWRIYDRLNTTISKLADLSGSLYSSIDTSSFMAKQIQTIDSNIYKEEDKISVYENRLYSQFGAMEEAIQKMNSQSSWLSQMLG